MQREGERTGRFRSGVAVQLPNWQREDGAGTDLLGEQRVLSLVCLFAEEAPGSIRRIPVSSESQTRRCQC